MKSLTFTTSIKAEPERVWRLMLEPETYRVWTSPFAEGSTYTGSWETGSRIRFHGAGGDDDAMVAEIAENRPHEFLSIRHLGVVKGGVEDTESAAVRAWAPAYENYAFARRQTPEGPVTNVTVTMDVMDEYEAMMRSSWPRALDALQGLAER